MALKYRKMNGCTLGNCRSYFQALKPNNASKLTLKLILEFSLYSILDVSCNIHMDKGGTINGSLHAQAMHSAFPMPVP